MKQNIFLMTAFHKNYFNIDSKDFFPIHVGKKLSNVDLGIFGDDTGDNISDKNKNFCELTALYWAWKNVDAEYYGLMHYRRYFLEPRGFLSKFFRFEFLEKKLRYFLKLGYSNTQIFLDEKEFGNHLKKFKVFLKNNLEKFDIFVPEHMYFPTSVKEQYEIYHKLEDLLLVKNIINNKHPQFLESFERVMMGNKLYAYNMFISKKDFYFTYMEWLFDILFELEKLINIDEYDAYQARVFGFLSERLFNVFLDYYSKNNKIIIKELPMAFLDLENKSGLTYE